MTHVLNEDQMCLDCIFPKYTVGSGYIEPAAQLKTLKLVPYRKYLGSFQSFQIGHFLYYGQ